MIIKNFYIGNEIFDIINITSIEPKLGYPRVCFMMRSSNLDRLKSLLTDEKYIYDVLYQYGLSVDFKVTTDQINKNSKNCWWYVSKAEYELEVKTGSSFFNLTVITEDKTNGESILRDRKLNIILNKK